MRRLTSTTLSIDSGFDDQGAKSSSSAQALQRAGRKLTALRTLNAIRMSISDANSVALSTQSSIETISEHVNYAPDAGQETSFSQLARQDSSLY